MRQVLLRIHADSFFSFEPIDGVAAVGLIVVLAAWCVYGAFLLWQVRREAALKNGTVDWVFPAAMWGGIALAILALPAVVTSTAIGSNLSGGIPIYGYGLMVFLGFVTGTVLAARRARSVGIDPELIWDLVIVVFAAGIGGARLFFLIQYWPTVMADKTSIGEMVFAAINLSDGGLVLYGGVLMVLVAGTIFAFKRKVEPLLLADIVFPSFFIGLAFGRMGCLLNGCCFGDRCELPWGIQFPEGSVPYGILLMRGFIDPAAEATFALHPTQIYSSLNAAILAAVSISLFRLRPPAGSVSAFALMSYPMTRFLLELVRGDEMGQLGTGFTISQFVSFGVVLTGVALSVYLFVRTRSRPIAPAI
ncbi:prolipoprotein diacylglyceryl transferase [Stratiformator vulcanicus]|uniref:Phosphatidylglycerol--prolipoprotein diacylglyceryl transferase n=1 Tax=Stratiformator vulcanicus TaxID=2527980 RepID=A0A517R3I5_9PLAN|nr:prolipoprotein diacylglyceryl transferase [Stratiformator vulcanicus]QDT38441.1 Prolipoprotein diacylglyceryl transferase [Stratiformator vulcanicus]